MTPDTSPIRDISFIVITLNEEFAIEKCLCSIAALGLRDCEVICVDSGSTDRTLEIIRSFKEKIGSLGIFTIRGYANAAIARNIGIRNAAKRYLFFIDGDFELSRPFIESAVQKLGSGYEAVTAGYEERRYREGGAAAAMTAVPVLLVSRERPVRVSGGTFIASRDAVKRAGEFDERFERCEDLEYTLRLSKGSVLLAIPEPIGIHHTLFYGAPRLLRRIVARGFPLYFGMLFRKHLFDPRGLLGVVGGMPGVLVGFANYILAVILLIVWGYRAALAGLLLFFCADLVKSRGERTNLAYSSIVHHLYPIFIGIGFFIRLDPRKPYTFREE